MSQSKSSIKKFTAENESTPVLVTITMANKNHLTTELNSLKSTSNKSGKIKSRRKSSSRKSISENSASKGVPLKDDLLSRKNKTNLVGMNNDAAENCGTVELMKLTQSLSTYINESELEKNPVASDCVTGACALSLNINNGSDGNNDINVSSSSSSQQLLNPSEDNSKGNNLTIH